MAQILLVEPYRILQQAIAVFLGRDHQVHVRESLRESELDNLKDCDALVLDASSLQEKGLLSAELLRGLERCEKPLLWLEDEQTLAAPRIENFAVLKKPLQERELREAVESLLAAQQQDPDRREAGATSTAHKTSRRGEQKEKKAARDSSQQPTLDFIDLVEVVEPVAEKRRATDKKEK